MTPDEAPLEFQQNNHLKGPSFYSDAFPDFSVLQSTFLICATFKKKTSCITDLKLVPLEGLNSPLGKASMLPGHKQSQRALALP